MDAKELTHNLEHPCKKGAYVFSTWSCHHEGEVSQVVALTLPLGKGILCAAASGLNPFGLTHAIK